MTLNITLVTPTRIFQSSDLRLFVPGVGRKTFPSCKAVRVTGSKFDGSITYTGVGEVNGLSTAQRIAGWLEGEGDLSLAQTLSLLHARLGPWFARLHRTGQERYPHTTVVAGFEEGVACLGLVSNFERLDAGPGSPSDSFVTTMIHGPRHVALVVTGQSAHVDRKDRAALQAAVKRHRRAPQEVSRQLRELNRRVALRAPDYVSETCVTMTLDADGTGAADLTQPAPIEFETVAFGARTPSLLAIAQKLSLIDPRMGGATFASSRQQPDPSRSSTTCDAAIDRRDSRYELEVLDVGLDRSTATSMNQHATVVGNTCSFEEPGAHHHWIRVANGPVRAIGPSVYNSGALTVSPDGLVGGALSHGVGLLRPYIFDDAVSLLAQREDCSACVNAINGAGTSVGWASIDPDPNLGQTSYRPAIGSRDGSTRIWADLPEADWGTAKAINEHGQVLVGLHQGMTSKTGLIESGELHLVNGDGLPGLVPVGLLDDGSVVGFAATPEGRLAHVWSPATGLVPLGTNPDWIPTAVSPSGWIAAQVTVDGTQAAETRSPDGIAYQLPTLWYHWARVHSITDTGSAAGAAGGMGHEHAVLWAIPTGPDKGLEATGGGDGGNNWRR